MKRMLITSALLALMLAACNDPSGAKEAQKEPVPVNAPTIFTIPYDKWPMPLPAEQPSRAITPVFDLNGRAFSLIVVVHPSLEDLNKSWRQWLYPTPAPFDVAGYTDWDEETHACVMHVTKPMSLADQDVVNTWGHELMHCVYGKYHVLGAR